MRLIKKILIFITVFISCTSSQSELEEQVLQVYKQNYPESAAILEDSELLNRVQDDCSFVEEGIEEYNSDYLDLEFFIDIHYIIFRIFDLEPQNVYEYMSVLYSYCGYESEFKENWNSIEIRETSFKNYSP
jgi:predicted transcriptional regulator with HTH domain